MAHPQLRVLPVNVFVGDKKIRDQRDPAATQRFYRECLNSPSALGRRSEPMGTEEMIAAFNSQLALNFDQMLGVFVASSRSAIQWRKPMPTWHQAM